MHELQRTMSELRRNGEIKKMDSSLVAALGAVARDIQTSHNNDKDMNERMTKLERTMDEIKQNMASKEDLAKMVSKDDLTQFKNELLPEIRKAAQFDLVQKSVNWKVIVGVAIGFLILVVLFAFGIRGLEIIAPIGNSAASNL